jgi:hypothetical protein
VHRPIETAEPLPARRAAPHRDAALGASTSAVLLDVDCIPESRPVARCADAARGPPVAGLLARSRSSASGRCPLDSHDPDRTPELEEARPAAGARPAPPDGALAARAPGSRCSGRCRSRAARGPRGDRRLRRGYVGYGAEDTDYAFRARAAGRSLHWVGGAWAYHQHHPVSSPPREHLDDIVVNARRFRARWGRWPMEGWLAAFAAEGLVRWDPAGELLERAGAAARSPPVSGSDSRRARCA